MKLMEREISYDGAHSGRRQAVACGRACAELPVLPGDDQVAAPFYLRGKGPLSSGGSDSLNYPSMSSIIHT